MMMSLHRMMSLLVLLLQLHLLRRSIPRRYRVMSHRMMTGCSDWR